MRSGDRSGDKNMSYKVTVQQLVQTVGQVVLELCMQINPRNKVFICLTLKSVKSNICLGKEVRDYHGLFLIHSLYARCPKGNYG